MTADAVNCCLGAAIISFLHLLRDEEDVIAKGNQRTGFGMSFPPVAKLQPVSCWSRSSFRSLLHCDEVRSDRMQAHLQAYKFDKSLMSVTMKAEDKLMRQRRRAVRTPLLHVIALSTVDTVLMMQSRDGWRKGGSKRRTLRNSIAISCQKHVHGPFVGAGRGQEAASFCEMLQSSAAAQPPAACPRVTGKSDRET